MPSPPRLALFAQPFGERSLGDALVDELQSGRWRAFRAVVAFLKRSGMRQLAAPVDSFLRQPDSQALISVGIDHDGTSLEGLQDLWRVVNGRAGLFVFKEGQGGPARTFHPKAYLFEKAGEALAIVGSGNLTAGGLFLNHEIAVSIRLDLGDPASALFHRQLREAIDAWQRPGPACREVDAELIRALFASEDLLPEATIAAGARAARVTTRRRGASQTAGRPVLFGSSGAAPRAPAPPPLPPMAPPAVTPPTGPAPAGQRRSHRRGGASRAVRTGAAAQPAHSTLLIEVRPHHNGEVFLSKLAVNEDPGFFGFPFTGWTTPHRASNLPYPMATPDPRVEIVVYDRQGGLLMRIPHSLNVVYYERKSEIRITLPPRPHARIPQFSLLAMTRSPSAAFDYRLEFFPPNCNTPRAQRMRASLTKKLPSGGAPQTRRYGWM